MDGIDASFFAGGIGENSSVIRQKICGNISTRNAKVRTFVIPTAEEYMIALATKALTECHPEGLKHKS